MSDILTLGLFLIGFGLTLRVLSALEKEHKRQKAPVKKEKIDGKTK